jgi:hypothetical protein
MGAGSVFLGLGAFGISNFLKNIGEASASIKAAPPILNNTSNNMSNIGSAEIRPFNVNVPEEELTELRRRIKATRWPEKDLVTDISPGVQLDPIQKLAQYWGYRL